MSVMVGSVMESLAPDDAFLLGLNPTLDVAARDATRVQLASTLSVLVGLFQVQSHQEYMPLTANPTPHPHPTPSDSFL